MKKHSLQFAVGGFLLGVTAPVGWLAIRMVFFYDIKRSFFGQIFADIIKDSEHFALYSYMGGGTAIVLAALGYLIGKSGDELLERAVELDVLHKEVEAQKEIFENRYKVLDSNIKNFHQISSKIQMSLNLEEILLLCAEGLHEVLGYERVNILMEDGNKHLRFITTAGTEGFDASGVALPLNASIGVIYKSFSERKVFLIDDISRFPEDYNLKAAPQQPPAATIKKFHTLPDRRKRRERRAFRHRQQK